MCAISVNSIILFASLVDVHHYYSDQLYFGNEFSVIHQLVYNGGPTETSCDGNANSTAKRQWTTDAALNSRRFMVMNLQHMAHGLGLQTAASRDELRQVISGKLKEMERDPPNVQLQREMDRR